MPTSRSPSRRLEQEIIGRQTQAFVTPSIVIILFQKHRLNLIGYMWIPSKTFIPLDDFVTRSTCSIAVSVHIRYGYPSSLQEGMHVFNIRFHGDGGKTFDFDIGKRCQLQRKSIHPKHTRFNLSLQIIAPTVKIPVPVQTHRHEMIQGSRHGTCSSSLYCLGRDCRSCRQISHECSSEI